MTHVIVPYVTTTRLEQLWNNRDVSVLLGETMTKELE